MGVLEILTNILYYAFETNMFDIKDLNKYGQEVKNVKKSLIK